MQLLCRAWAANGENAIARDSILEILTVSKDPAADEVSGDPPDPHDGKPEDHGEERTADPLDKKMISADPTAALIQDHAFPSPLPPLLLFLESQQAIFIRTQPIRGGCLTPNNDAHIFVLIHPVLPTAISRALGGSERIVPRLVYTRRKN